jgi:hypothetical protein
LYYGQSVFPDIALHISNYYINILHARLRQKCSSLTLDLFRCNLIASYNYDCGNYTESVDHLFLACDIYTEHRIQLFRGMREGHMENVQPIISLLFILICNNSNFNTNRKIQWWSVSHVINFFRSSFLNICLQGEFLKYVGRFFHSGQSPDYLQD